MAQSTDNFVKRADRDIRVMNTIEPHRAIRVMGIINLTDDSYFAASRHSSDAQVLRSVERMVADGADIIDFGACSTRPGAEAVGAEVEWSRLSGALAAVRREFPSVQISVDTYHSSVVARSFDAIGPFIVNDISAGEDDPEMLSIVGKAGLTYIAMHKRGTPATMQSLCQYDDVVSDVCEYFEQFAERAARAGISDWILDPGFGFAKNIAQNYRLLSELDRLCCLGRPILVGISRKSMIYKLLGTTPETCLPQTCALHLAALERGADILRVHDVKEAADTVKIYRQLTTNTL